MNKEQISKLIKGKTKIILQETIFRDGSSVVSLEGHELYRNKPGTFAITIVEREMWLSPADFENYLELLDKERNDSAGKQA